MLAALISIAFLAAFATLPLVWLSLGVPWLPLAITFVVIPLLDAAVGAGVPKALVRVPSGLARWVARVQLPLQPMLLAGAVTAAPALSWSELAVFAFAVGTVTGGLGITIVHELRHRACASPRRTTLLPRRAR